MSSIQAIIACKKALKVSMGYQTGFRSVYLLFYTKIGHADMALGFSESGPRIQEVLGWRT
jgi:hypothetical protein